MALDQTSLETLKAVLEETERAPEKILAACEAMAHDVSSTALPNLLLFRDMVAVGVCYTDAVRSPGILMQLLKDKSEIVFRNAILSTIRIDDFWKESPRRQEVGDFLTSAVENPDQVSLAVARKISTDELLLLLADAMYNKWEKTKGHAIAPEILLKICAWKKTSTVQKEWILDRVRATKLLDDLDFKVKGLRQESPE